MSAAAPPCSCRLPWIITVIALGILVAERFLTLTPSVSETPAAVTAPTPTPPTPIPATDPRIATLQHDLNETRRVLDDVQSALAQRDREIATANDDLRVLRQELDAIRAKQVVPKP
jgi:hypothetical protein